MESPCLHPYTSFHSCSSQEWRVGSAPRAGMLPDSHAVAHAVAGSLLLLTDEAADSHAVGRRSSRRFPTRRRRKRCCCCRHTPAPAARTCGPAAGVRGAPVRLRRRRSGLAAGIKLCACICMEVYIELLSRSSAAATSPIHNI